MEGESENGDQGFSPNDRVSSSSVGSTEGGAGFDGDIANLSESDRNSAVNMHVVSQQDSSSPVGLQILADGMPFSLVIDGDRSLEENFSTTAQHGSVDQESSALAVDFVDVKSRLGDESPFHDAGREDMFVDAPDELSMSDGRSIDNGESTFYVEPQEGPEENLGIQVGEDEKQVRQLAYELALLQASLEKANADKEIMSQKYKEEREMVGRELGHLHRQLQTIANHDDNDNGFVNRLREEEKEYDEGETFDSDASLQLMISDCSKSTAVLQRALVEQSQSEGTIRELHAVIFAKDQEIQNLSAKISELSVSHDLIERDQHREVVMEKMLASLASVVQREDLSDDSSVDRIYLLERSTSLMIENYIHFLSEIDKLKQCLTEVVTEAEIPDNIEVGTVFDMVCRELLDHKRMEADFIEKLKHVENENKNLLEQLDRAKERIDVNDGEVRKLKMELEQEKIKSTNTKEKLGMAVTKGKALVQQRDSLKQSLNEKTNELEKCLLELQEKSNALESAEMRTEECQSLAASLQDSLSMRTMTLEKIQEVLSGTDIPDEILSMDINECVRWLADQKNELLGLSLENNKVKSLLSSLNLPEVVASYKLESQISWLGESLSVAEDNIDKLQGEVISSKVEVASLEAELGEALNEIEHLKTSLSEEKRGKDSLQMGLEDLLSKYEAIVEKEFQLTSEKNRMARMFREACGVEDQGEFHDPYSNMATFIDMCVGKIKENHSKSSNAGTEQFERMQSLLYLRNQEVVLCRDILEEEMLKRSEMTTIADELERVSKEIITLKDEKDSLQKDLERSDDKSSLLRDKLSMAVKKGKGLVQEREGLKKSIDERNSEIEKLKLELQQQESELSGCRDQINGLSSDLEGLSQLESDLVAMKDQKDQLEKYLVESNVMLERVVESIESIALPVDTVFADPVEKIKWLADCFGEYQHGKVTADQELEKVKQEVNSLSGKLVEASATIGSLEDALSKAEKNYYLLAEEKKDIQIGMNNLEGELEKAQVEAGSQGSKFLEACTNIKLLEDALSRAKKNIAVLEEEKASACLDKNSAESELEKLKEEADYQARKLAEAYTTIKSLEEGFTEMERRVSVLTEENNVAQAAMPSLERELEKAKAEANSQASKLADVHATVKSLEDALSAAGENIILLTAGKENAEMELQALNAKLSACMAELAGTHGSLESQSVELFSHLNHLKVIMNDDTLLSSFTQGFMKKFEGLRDINFHLENIRNQLVEQSSEELQTNSGTEKDLYVAKAFSACIDKFSNGTIHNIETNAIDFSDILSYITYIVEGFNKKNKLLEDKFEGFSSSMDELIVILLRALQETRENVVGLLEPMKFLKLDVKALGAHNQAVESAIFTLKNDITMLLSTWSDAAHDLGFQLDNSLVGLISNLDPENSSNDSHLVTREASEGAMELHVEHLGGNDYVEAAENLGRELRSQIKKLENLMKLLLASAGELRNKLNEAQLSSQKAMEERDLHQNRISALERDIEALQEFCNELKIKLKDHEAKEDMLKERDEELSLLHRSLAKKEQETEGYFLSEGQVKTLFEKIDQIEIPSEESDTGSSEFHISGAARKLFSIIDNVTGMQHQMRLLTHAKEELQSSLALQVDEIERLKKEAESLLSINQDLGKTESDLTELTIDVERLIQKFEGNDLIKDNKFGVKGLLTALENLIMASVRECETSKSKAQESNVKLHENQKVVDELSEKVKLLEGSIQSRPALPDVVQERSISKEPSLPTGSEISEIEDVAPIGRNSVSPVPYAAHVRTMRKGSSDHLALTIDSESDRLINHHEIDDDKGHAFKSLNTSGLIPIQGKLMADRIDGIWVSGGRVLMSRPRARMGVIAYCLLLHLWLLGGIIL
ncbi:hypothetical protein AQUCO_01100357v1 [Aquilegia coerulea]|uniref:Uncharacterized protein n=1 Tax=Aquilegia coerulea TaxID=218851 RepID=A0A2G5E6S9_AQUCA|nr:hypothetical protein AQUCO_01100357v1 [Aquilegia coerulea]